MIIAHTNLAKGFRGGERQTALLIEYLSKLDIEHQYLVCRKDSVLRKHLAHISDLTFVDANHQLQGHFGIPKADVVQAHDAKAVHWAWIQKKLHSKPYVLTRRIDNPVKNKRFNQITYTSASRRVAISNIVEQNLRAKNWGEVCKIPDCFAYLSSNPEHTAELKHPFENKYLVGHVGALSDHHKGQRVLIAAAKRLEQSYPEIQFLFYGRGDDAEALRQESQHLSNVHWQGFVDYVGDVIPMFDVFAFPSRMEGLGSTLLDVMYFNVPIIASNVGGIPDIIKHEETGLLFENADDEALAEGIITLYQNRQHAKTLAEQAKKQLSLYSPEAMAQSYFNLYKEILES